jgi:transcriptional regulator with XRE-family HTH domain
MERKILGKKIRIERQLLGLSQDRFAKQIGASKATLQRIETGAKSPSVELLAEISHVCRKPIHEFLVDNGGDFVLHNSSAFRRITGKDFEITILSPYGQISSNILVNHYRGDPGAGINPTEDKAYHWVYILKGACSFEYEGKSYQLKKGDLIYYDARKTFSFKVLQALENIRIAIRV